MSTVAELKAYLDLISQYPELNVQLVLSVEAVSAPGGDTGGGDTNPPPPASFPVCQIEAGSKASQAVKVRPEANPGVGGPTLKDGTDVYHLATYDKNAYGITWRYVKTLDGLLQGFVQDDELVC